MTDEQITRTCAEQFFGLDGLGMVKLRPSGEDFSYGVDTVARSEDRRITNCPNPSHIGKRYPDPLTNDADACAVLNKMSELEMWINIRFLSYSNSIGGWVVSVAPEPISKHYEGEDMEHWSVIHTESSNRCRAICIAALKAVGVWEE